MQIIQSDLPIANEIEHEVRESVWIPIQSLRRLAGPDCLSLDTIIFRNGGTVNSELAIPFIIAPNWQAQVAEKKAYREKHYWDGYASEK